MVNITLNGLEATVTLDLSGQLYTADSGFLDVSCNSSFEVSLTEMKNVFKFQTDAENIIDATAEQIRYYVDAAKWGSEIAAGNNPANAQIDETIGASTAPIATGGVKQANYPDNKMYVCHDFIRFLAQKLFNTHEGVDLFVNELEVLNSIRTSVYDTVWSFSTGSVIKNALQAVDMTAPSDPTSALLNQDQDNKYFTTSEDSDSSGNICRVIAEHLMLHVPERFASIDTQAGDAMQSLPLEENDTLDFKITIKPAAGQHDLTGVDPIEGRSYKVSLVLKTTPTAQVVAADEL
jgi:hypothetical protein